MDGFFETTVDYTPETTMKSQIVSPN